MGGVVVKCLPLWVQINRGALVFVYTNTFGPGSRRETGQGGQVVIVTVRNPTERGDTCLIFTGSSHNRNDNTEMHVGRTKVHYRISISMSLWTE